MTETTPIDPDLLAADKLCWRMRDNCPRMNLVWHHHKESQYTTVSCRVGVAMCGESFTWQTAQSFRGDLAEMLTNRLARECADVFHDWLLEKETPP
jgi:hypothetical protein